MDNSSLWRTTEELSQIYHRHVKTVFRVCYIYMKNQYDTEDMVQNTFIKLMKDKTQFQSEEHEKAWLIKTATNLCKDYFRSWWSKRISLEEAELTQENHPVIDETLEKVLGLPPKYKIAVYLHYYEGYSAVEIAKILKKNESTVRGYLHTGRKLLRIEMEGDFK
ncbi:MAG: rpoD2 [Herbinix sp.]|nr:rpoD2 [Herbinix sp.]